MRQAIRLTENEFKNIVKQTLNELNDWETIRYNRADGMMTAINYYLDVMDKRGYLSDEQKKDADSILNKLCNFGEEAEKFCDVARQDLGLNNEKLDETIHHAIKKVLKENMEGQCKMKLVHDGRDGQVYKYCDYLIYRFAGHRTWDITKGNRMLGSAEDLKNAQMKVDRLIKAEKNAMISENSISCIIRKVLNENTQRTRRVEYDESLSKSRGRDYYFCPDNGRYYTNIEGRWLTCTDNYYLEPDCHVSDDVKIVVVS